MKKVVCLSLCLALIMGGITGCAVKPTVTPAATGEITKETSSEISSEETKEYTPEIIQPTEEKTPADKEDKKEEKKDITEEITEEEIQLISSVDEIPEDFSFALTWSTYGISSYDSKTGKLVKTDRDVRTPENFITNYMLTDEDKVFIYNQLLALNVYSYPDIFDPENGVSIPDRTLIITLREKGGEKTIKAEHVSVSPRSITKKGQKFLDTCKEISNLLRETEEWKALPPPELMYD